MTYTLGIDVGTTHTAAAILRNGRTEVLRLGSRRAEVPSLVFVPADGPVLIGEPAERRGQAEPSRLAREFKRRVGDPVPMLVGGAPYSAHAMIARQLEHVLRTAVAHQGGPPDHVVLTCPANWGPYKRELLEQAARLADLPPVELRTEPEAAAIEYAAGERMGVGDVIAVYDLGGGTFDAAVLRRTADGFDILGTPEGIEQLGGIDFDEAVFEHVVQTLPPDRLAEPDVAALARLRRDCIEAKEALSDDTEVLIPVALPNLHTRVRLTRTEFEAMIRPALTETVGAVRRALRSAGVRPEELRTILLSGGSSRIPLVSQLLSTEFDRPVVLDPHPEHSIAQGAARSSQRLPNPVQQTPMQHAPVHQSPVRPAPAQPSPQQPWTGQPSPVQPSPAQSAPGQPTAGQPTPGQPWTGQPSPAQSAPGQASPGQPPHGQPPHGQPPHGQPPHGQPSQGQPSQGQPSQGQPSPLWPEPANAGSGRSLPVVPGQFAGDQTAPLPSAAAVAAAGGRAQPRADDPTVTKPMPVTQAGPSSPPPPPPAQPWAHGVASVSPPDRSGSDRFAPDRFGSDTIGPRRRLGRQAQIVLAAVAVLVIGGVTTYFLSQRGPDDDLVAGSPTSSAAVTAAASTAASVKPVPTDCGKNETFDAAVVSPGWERTRPEIDVPLSGSAAKITAPDGADIYEDRVNAPMLLRTVPGDFVMETTVAAKPDQLYQGAGLVLYVDDEHYVRLELGYGDVQAIAFEYRDGGAHTKVHPPKKNDPNVIVSKSNDVVLQLERSGNKVTARWATGKNKPSSIGTINLDLPDTVKAGVAVLNRAQKGAEPEPFEATFYRVWFTC